ncbi:amidase [soil metagenome]
MASLAALGWGGIAEAETFTLSEATIGDISKALDSGALSSVELTVLYLNRIQTYDVRGIKLNAIPVMNANVLADAATADRLRAQGRTDLSLLGVPYTIKDSYKAKGMTVAAGSPAFAKLIANEDAFTVGRLRGAGAVLVGRTNMPPLAAGGMQRGVYGRAESPYNGDYLTAAWNSGSSNGSGTSTGASFAAFGMGEETVSSGRSPSSNNGLVAYTPSRGMISIRGNWPLFPIKDVVVPMTRTMGDMFAVLDVIVADDPVTRGDFWRNQKAVPLPAPSTVRPAHYADLARPDALKGKRIGVPTMYIGKDNSGKPIPVRPSILALWERTAAVLRAHGAEVVEVDFTLMHNYDMDRPEAQSPIDRGLVPVEWFARMKNGQRSGTDLEFDKLNPYLWQDFVVANADPNLPDWSRVDPGQVFPFYPGSVDYRRFGPTRDTYAKAKVTILAGVVPVDTLPKFAEMLQGLERFRKVDFEDWLTAGKLDFIAFPSAADIGRANADVDDAAYDHATSNGVSRSNTNSMLRHLGIPSVSVTMGVLSDIGMPVNVTFAGRAYDDNALLSYGYAFEQATHFRQAPKRVAALADERIDYDPASVVAPAKRKEKTPPVVAISPSASKGVGAVTFSGTASDASGLGVVRIYVNGHKAAETTAARWQASVPLETLATWRDAGETSVSVTALAKDRLGNTAAVTRIIAVPATPAKGGAS